MRFVWSSQSRITYYLCIPRPNILVSHTIRNSPNLWAYYLMDEILYGRNPVLEALRAGSEIEKILIAENVQHPRLTEIARLAKQGRVAVQRVPRAKLSALAPEHKTQGVAAYLSAGKYADVADILKLSADLQEPPLIACLDGIEDPHNLGAILRSADGAGFHGVIVPKRRAAGLTATVAKTSAGASLHIPTAKVGNLNYTIDELKAQNIWIAGADQEGAQLYTDADLTGALAVVVGAEGQGLHRLVREKCDFLVRIPMYGKINSLNASVAAALLFFEVRRQREIQKRGGK